VKKITALMIVVLLLLGLFSFVAASPDATAELTWQQQFVVAAQEKGLEKAVQDALTAEKTVDEIVNGSVAACFSDPAIVAVATTVRLDLAKVTLALQAARLAGVGADCSNEVLGYDPALENAPPNGAPVSQSTAPVPLPGSDPAYASPSAF
jgi:Tfp pilus assembly protein PilV